MVLVCMLLLFSSSVVDVAGGVGTCCCCCEINGVGIASVLALPAMMLVVVVLHVCSCYWCC